MAQVCFNALPWIGVPNSIPFAICQNDFNEDGQIDIAVTNLTGSPTNFHLLFGTGGGNFSSPTNVTTNSRSSGIVSEDFNGDSHKDIAITQYDSNSVFIFSGNGTGAFSLDTIITVGIGPGSIISDDLNNDGFYDLTITNYGSNNISVLLNNGNTNFNSPLNVSSSPAPIDICSKDLNADGIVDIITANQNPNNISVLLGTVGGIYLPATDYSVGVGVKSVISEDFNSDGIPDIATANYSNSVSILLGNGVGGFGTASNITVGLSPYEIGAGDFNNDGVIDLATSDWGDSFATTGSVSILLGDGVGNFTLSQSIPMGTNPWSILIGDYNNDGADDIITSSDNFSVISVLLNCNQTNINEITLNNSYIIYPNPASDNFKIESTLSDKCTLKITDLYGEEKLTKTINNKESIDISNLNAGIYNITIHNKNSTANKKLIVIN